jgi:hypothetical protein
MKSLKHQHQECLIHHQLVCMELSNVLEDMMFKNTVDGLEEYTSLMDILLLVLKEHAHVASQMLTIERTMQTNIYNTEYTSLRVLYNAHYDRITKSIRLLLRSHNALKNSTTM